MLDTTIQHPAEDELERFLLSYSPEEELEEVESHILGCDTCVVRLEDLEVEIAVTRLALKELQAERTARAEVKQLRRASSWFTLPKLSLAGGLAALVLGVIAIPQLVEQSSPVAEVSLSTYRGSENVTVPGGYRLRMHLNAGDLAESAIKVHVVDAQGTQIWHGDGAVHQERVDVTLPPIKAEGAYFLRLYATNPAGLEGDLLREFAFQVK